MLTYNRNCNCTLRADEIIIYLARDSFFGISNLQNFVRFALLQTFASSIPKTLWSGFQDGTPTSIINKTIPMHIYLRSENKSSLAALLSEDSKRKRQRTNTINIKMTFISWLLEFTAGAIIIPTRYYSPTVGRWVAGADIVLNFILIPASYVMHNEVNRKVIIADGWIRGCRRLLTSSTPTVDPAQNNDQGAINNPGSVPPPIRTIAGNIKALDSVKNKDNAVPGQRNIRIKHPTNELKPTPNNIELLPNLPNTPEQRM